MRFERFIATFFKEVKREAISKTINNSRTRRKFLVKKVKHQKNFIKPIIHVDNGTLDLCSLVWDKRIQR